MTNHLTFKRKVDGVLGVGFLHNLGTHKVYSVAWPDAEARKYIAEPDEMDRMGVAVVEQSPISPAVAMESLSAAFSADSDYAWSWHCNIAMAYVDAGGDPQNANEAASRFMSLAFGAKDYAPASETRLVVSGPDGVTKPLLEAIEEIKISPDGTVEPTEGNAIVVDGDGAKVVPVAGSPIFDVSGSFGVILPDVSNLEFAPGGVPCPDDSPTKEQEPNTFTEAQAIRDHLNKHGLDVSNKSVVEALKAKGFIVKSSQVTEAKEQLKKELGS